RYKPKKESYGLHIRSSLAVYNAIIALSSAFVNSFFQLCQKSIYFCRFKCKKYLHFYKSDDFSLILRIF
ncbi:hypothetical protein, partial [uncultured Ruminococcus sp.]|uniref:hypothetical protein n=1 Tax=uncultured Ruminococcus sp. TaxID=165186 RepID=UPI0025F0DE3A